MAEIARLKCEEGVGAVICTYHGGQEYGDARTDKQQSFAKDAIAAARTWSSCTTRTSCRA